ncbi:hypothetical protein [Kitasatospora purpeofusca]|uniref:hypothetical protein n=1 Tax=Kitasatospora purpeofusca TaxID=67352 RepID=UPI002A5A684A|nr:hypothetical protein [Kitasatospora purpeofusca]MDY0811080.1 hypothetical protein [Kitasatospora purpeofusca]
MYTIVGLLAGLGGLAGAAVVHLVRRDRHRREGDVTGLLIERRRTAEAAQLRSACTSNPVHHGGGPTMPNGPYG